jgi:hypothetical protein
LILQNFLWESKAKARQDGSQALTPAEKEMLEAESKLLDSRLHNRAVFFDRMLHIKRNILKLYNEWEGSFHKLVSSILSDSSQTNEIKTLVTKN